MLAEYQNCFLQKANPILASHEFNDSVQDPKWTHRMAYDRFVNEGFVFIDRDEINPILGNIWDKFNKN